jgi:hypothetical protein
VANSLLGWRVRIQAGVMDFCVVKTQGKMQDNQKAERSKDKVQKENKSMKNFPDDVFVIFH